MLNWKQFEVINENLSKARSILRGLNIEESDKDFQALRKLLQNNTGYLGKFTEWMFVQKISLKRLETLLTTLREEKISIPIDSFKTPEAVIDHITKDNADKGLNQMIQSIPSRTREFLEEYEVMKQLKSFLSRNINSKEKIIRFFSRKGGTLDEMVDNDGIESVIETLKKIISFPLLSDISKVSKSKNKDIEFIFEDEEMLVISIKRYEGIVKYGSSYWCIVQDEYTYDDYVTDKGNIQLIVFYKQKDPFSDKSMMGITLESGGDIYAAHWEDDEDCHKEAGKIILKIKNVPEYRSNIHKSIDIDRLLSKLEDGDITFDHFVDIFDFMYVTMDPKKSSKIIQTLIIIMSDALSSGDDPAWYKSLSKFKDKSYPIPELNLGPDDIGLVFTLSMNNIELDFQKICDDLLEKFNLEKDRKKSSIRSEINSILVTQIDELDPLNLNLKIVINLFWNILNSSRSFKSSPTFNSSRSIFYNFGLIGVDDFLKENNFSDDNFTYLLPKKKEEVVDWHLKNNKISGNLEIFLEVCEKATPEFISKNQSVIADIFVNYHRGNEYSIQKVFSKIMRNISDELAESIARKVVKVPSDISDLYEIKFVKKK
jgi:hypothetical protein